jgi:hypothetical protein
MCGDMSIVPDIRLVTSSESTARTAGRESSLAESIARPNGLIYRTTAQLNAPLHNPESEEVTSIEVTDPAHPLFGRHFQVLSISSSLNSPGHVFVAYQEKMVLRIPLSATSLVPPRAATRTKLTSHSVVEFISRAHQCEVLCQPDHKTSGDTCHPHSNNTSSRTSRRSSRR